MTSQNIGRYETEGASSPFENTKAKNISDTLVSLFSSFIGISLSFGFMAIIATLTATMIGLSTITLLPIIILTGVSVIAGILALGFLVTYAITEYCSKSPEQNEDDIQREDDIQKKDDIQKEDDIQKKEPSTKDLSSDDSKKTSSQSQRLKINNNEKNSSQKQKTIQVNKDTYTTKL